MYVLAHINNVVDFIVLQLCVCSLQVFSFGVAKRAKIEHIRFSQTDNQQIKYNYDSTNG